jgi:PIN domain nuclease of toxin-antitoxin system
MPTHILDASAVIALMAREPGAERVRELVRSGSAGISTVNASEVASKLVARGAKPKAAEYQCRSMGLEFIAVDAAIAFAAAALLPLTSALGLSLGDRICLATAATCGVPAVTADRAWAKLTGIAVEVIR